MGDHAAVYGRPALVAAIDLRLRATFAATGGAHSAENAEIAEIELDLPDLAAAGGSRSRAAPEALSWQEVRAYARAARSGWADYAAQPDSESFRRLRGDDPAHVVKVALGESAEAFGAAGGGPAASPPLSLRVDSELPIGAGFGSSAATAVALVGGYLLWRRGTAPAGRSGAAGATSEIAALAGPASLDEGDLARIEALALEAERRQHGLPSGIDTATVVHGGLLWVERRPDGTLACQKLAPRGAGAARLGRLRVYHTGTPPEPTGAVVAAVRARRDREPARHERIFDRMAAAAAALREALAPAAAAVHASGSSPVDDPGLDPVIDLIREHCRCLEELGVVPGPVRAVVRQVEKAGGAAKVSGAGSLAGPGAGSLLVYHSDPGQVAAWDFLRGFRPFPVELGAAGFRSEP